MKHHLVTLFGVFALSILLIGLSFALPEGTEGEQHPDVDFDVSCMECHAEETPEIFSDWQGSKHGFMNFGCYMCHGDGTVDFEIKPDTDKCASCHGGYSVDFSRLNVNSCFDCHPGHRLKLHPIEN